DGGTGNKWSAHHADLLATLTALFGPGTRVDDVWLWRGPPGPPPRARGSPPFSRSPSGRAWGGVSPVVAGAPRPGPAAAPAPRASWASPSRARVLASWNRSPRSP